MNFQILVLRVGLGPGELRLRLKEMGLAIKSNNIHQNLSVLLLKIKCPIPCPPSTIPYLFPSPSLLHSPHSCLLYLFPLSSFLSHIFLTVEEWILHPHCTQWPGLSWRGWDATKNTHFTYLWHQLACGGFKHWLFSRCAWRGELCCCCWRYHSYYILTVHYNHFNSGVCVVEGGHGGSCSQSATTNYTIPALLLYNMCLFTTLYNSNNLIWLLLTMIHYLVYYSSRVPATEMMQHCLTQHCNQWLHSTPILLIYIEVSLAIDVNNRLQEWGGDRGQ